MGANKKSGGTIIVKMGKILLFGWGAYFHSGMAIFTVKIGNGMPIFNTVAYIW